jgi:NAD(P)-dependent dehydrogenase (short-subunit alcohol dehydrogenase family)
LNHPENVRPSSLKSTCQILRPPTANVLSSEPTRRDFLYVATASAGVIDVASTLIPLIGQMNPDASTIAAGGPVNLDLANIQPGHRWWCFGGTCQSLWLEQRKKMISNAVPAGRFGWPEEIAKAVVFLASDDAITGAELFVDGGPAQV